MKITEKQVKSLRDLIQQQIESHRKLSVVLWSMIDDKEAPNVRYYDIIDTVKILNKELADEIVWNIWQCPADGGYVEENNTKVRVARNDYDSLIAVLRAKDLIADDKDDICFGLSGMCGCSKLKGSPQ